ncbi:hypothetical protein MKW92_019385 [Papaver armeniacum]|nr:hypothetical protein MKW92_019385 [Papaver armeniacum]
MVTPGEVLGYSSTLIPGKGAYLHNKTIYASLTGRRVIIPPSSDSPDQKRSIVEVTGHKAHGAVPEPGSIIIARVTKVMAKMTSADIMCVGTKSVKEKFSGVISSLLEMHELTIFLLRRMNWVLYLLKASEEQQWFQSVVQRCSVL